MARTRVNDTARVSDLNYEGTLDIQDIDLNPLDDAVEQYNELKTDEFDRLEQNVKATSELQNETLSESFDNVAQKELYEELRGDYGMTDEGMWGVDFGNEYSVMATQKKASKMLQDPRYQDMKREQVKAQSAFDYLQKNAEKMGELAPLMARRLNQYYEGEISAFDINPSDYIPFDLDGTMTTVSENMHDDISTIIQSTDNPSVDFISKLVSRGRDRVGRIAREYMLKDDPATRNTMLQKGYVTEDGNGEFRITELGMQEIRKQQEIFGKRQEVYQSQVRKSKGGKSLFEELEIPADSTRAAYYNDDSAKGRQAQAMDRTLWDLNAPSSTLNSNGFAQMVYNQQPESPEEQARFMADVATQYPEVLYADPFFRSLEDTNIQLSDESQKLVNGFLADLAKDRSMREVLQDDGTLKIDGKKLKDEGGSEIQIYDIMPNGLGSYTSNFSRSVNDGKLTVPERWNPLRAHAQQRTNNNPTVQGTNTQTQSVSSSGGSNSASTRMASPEDLGSFGMTSPASNNKEGGAVSTEMNMSNAEVVEDFDNNWDYAKIGDSYMTKRKGSDKWNAAGDAREAIANKVFNRGNMNEEISKKTSEPAMGPTNEELSNTYEPGSNENLDVLKNEIGTKETNNTYDLLNGERSPGNLVNGGHSSAMGKYQFIWTLHKDDIKKFAEPVDKLTPSQKRRFKQHRHFRKLSDDELRYVQGYLQDKEAQEKHFNYHHDNYLTSGLDRFKKKAKSAAKVLTDNQIKRLIHYLGAAGATEAANEADWEVSPTAGTGVKNSKIADYIDMSDDQLAKLTNSPSQRGSNSNLAR